MKKLMINIILIAIIMLSCFGCGIVFGSCYTITHQNVYGESEEYDVVFNGTRYSYSCDSGEFKGLD